MLILIQHSLGFFQSISEYFSAVITKFVPFAVKVCFPKIDPQVLLKLSKLIIGTNRIWSINDFFTLLTSPSGGHMPPSDKIGQSK